MSLTFATHDLVTPARLELTDEPNRFVLAVETIDHSGRFGIEGTPSLVAARLFARSVRHIHKIRFCHSGGAWTATAEVTGHRLPQSRPISIRTALALALLGHRVAVCSDLLERDEDGGGAS